MKEIDCMARLFKLADCYTELVEFMIQEKILGKSDLTSLKLDSNKPRFLLDILKKAVKDDKLLLLDFNWIILPVERIRIHLVTERSTKELAYKY